MNDDIVEIDPNIWFCIEPDKKLIDLGVDRLEYRIDNNTRPQVRVSFNKKPKSEDIKEILACPLLRARSKDALEKWLTTEADKGKSIEYKGNDLQNVVRKKLIPSLDHHYR